MYKAYITELKNVRPHSNADRLQLADCFGNTVCIDFSFKEGDIGIYFPEGGQLSEEFCRVNDLVRRKDENGNPTGGYLDPIKRNIVAIRLRGEKSEGLFLPLSSLDYTKAELSVGDAIDIVNGHEICTKYIPHSNSSSHNYNSKEKVYKKKEPIAPLFREHTDTAQLAYNLDAFSPGDQIEITLKMHGTSGRTGYLPVLKGYDDSWRCKLKNTIKKYFNKNYEEIHNGKPIYEYDYVTGSRRVVLNSANENEGFYGTNAFRYEHERKFKEKLQRGETVYYEIVGFLDSGAPIMGEGKTPKELEKIYGKTTCFSYGCEPHPSSLNCLNADNIEINEKEKLPQSDIYVYRMTMTNEDGYVVEYSPDFMRYRCEQMGIKSVPVFWQGYIQEEVEDVGEWIKEKAEKYYDGPDPVGKTHIREGVVVRIINRPTFKAYKHKNFSFKLVSGIVSCSEEVSEDILSEL